MTKAAPRSFRLEKRTNRQLAKLAANLHITQTEAIEMGVQLLANQHLPSETSVEETRITDNERLAEQYDEVAESWMSDDDLNGSLRENMYRVLKATAEQYRREG